MDDRQLGNTGEQRNGKKDIHRQYLSTSFTTIAQSQYTEYPL